MQGGWNKTTALMRAVDRGFEQVAIHLLLHGADGLKNTVNICEEFLFVFLELPFFYYIVCLVEKYRFDYRRP